MVRVKNRIILVLSLFVLLASLIVHFLHRFFNVSSYWIAEHGSHPAQLPLITNIFLVLPILLFMATIFFYRLKQDHPLVPLLNTLTITFSSMSMITGGEGMVEYHFSIFMVVAMVGYYERISLILTMTALFAVQHVAGYLFLSEYVFGTSEYSFIMVCIHALFLIGTSSAIIWQIIHKRKLLADLDEKEEKQQILSGIIEKLSFTSEKLIDASSKLKSNYDSNRLAIKDIVTHIQKISIGADTQKQQTEDSSKAMQEIASGIQRIAETSTIVSEISVKTTHEAGDGNAMIQKTAQQMRYINEKVSTSSETVKMLNERSKEIGDFVGLITDIASQTNLLALNAAIEAARAGEHGKGFAVVADEVRKLAEQSAGSASKITSIIQAIQEDTNSSVDSMNHVIHEVKAGLDIVQETGEIFERIQTSIDGVANQIKQISFSAVDVSAAAEQAAASVHEMTSFAEAATANAQNVANSSEGQLTSVEFLFTLITTLNDITLELEELINKTEELK